MFAHVSISVFPILLAKQRNEGGGTGGGTQHFCRALHFIDRMPANLEEYNGVNYSLASTNYMISH